MVLNEPITVQNKFVKFVWDSTKNPKVIQLTAGSESTTGRTYHLDGVNYVVPSGKEFIGLWHSSMDRGTTGKTVTIYQADNADSTTGEVDKTIVVALNGNSVTLTNAFDFYGKWSAGKYVNWKVTTTTGTNPTHNLIGFEQDV